MRLLARLALLPLLIAALVACGGSDDTSDDNTAADETTSSAAPEESDDDYPTDASVEDYCEAYRGEDPDFTRETATLGDLIEFFEEGHEKILETGIPADFTDAQRAAFDDQSEKFETAIAALKDIDQDDMLVTDAAEDEAIQEKVTNAMEYDTPQPLRDYSSENC